MSHSIMTTLLVFIFLLCPLIHILLIFLLMEGNSATFRNILILLGSIIDYAKWTVTCKNDNSAGFHFLVMSTDAYFNFISGLFLSNHLK